MNALKRGTHWALYENRNSAHQNKNALPEDKTWQGVKRRPKLSDSLKLLSDSFFRLVAVMVRFVGAFDRDTEVFSLFFVQRG